MMMLTSVRPLRLHSDLHSPLSLLLLLLLPLLMLLAPLFQSSQANPLDVDELCQIRCNIGRGGVLCKCNAFHFAGKRSSHHHTADDDDHEHHHHHNVFDHGNNDDDNHDDSLLPPYYGRGHDSNPASSASASAAVMAAFGGGRKYWDPKNGGVSSSGSGRTDVGEEGVERRGGGGGGGRGDGGEREVVREREGRGVMAPVEGLWTKKRGQGRSSAMRKLTLLLKSALSERQKSTSRGDTFKAQKWQAENSFPYVTDADDDAY